MHSGVYKLIGVQHFFIGVQSSTKDCDYLEHRINTFIEDLKHNWPLKKEDVKKAVESKINSLLQKKTSLSSETNSHWNKILSEKKFQNRDEAIEAYRRVTY